MWTGQLPDEYNAATSVEGSPSLFFSGVVLESPASNILVDPAVQGDDALGTGMLDRVVHTNLQLTGQPESIPLVPFFMSYLVEAWVSHANSGIPDPTQMPAFPVEGTLEREAIIAAAGVETVEQMTSFSWADGADVARLAMPFAGTPFLVPDLDDGVMIDGVQHGNFDRYFSSGDVSPGLATGLAWMQYSNPGPRGVHPFSKVPVQDGVPVPVLITAGSNDGVVHCVAADPERLPTAKEGVPVALFEALREVYEQDGAVAAYLSLLIWKPEDGVTVADHSDVAGLIAAASTDDSSFHGSPLETFIAGAFAGALQRDVTASFGNP